MNDSRARAIADRANAVRAMLDLREQLRQRRLLFGGIFVLAVIGPNAARAALTPHIGSALGWFVCWTLLGGLVVASLAFHRVRRRRMRESGARMLCPRCRYILREDGPDLWTTCDDITRVCPECAFAVSDDVYAAAALPSIRDRAKRIVNASSGPIVTGLAIAAFAVGGFAIVGVFGQRLLGDAIWFVALLAIPLFGVVLAFALSFRMQRHIDALIASWVDSPWCPGCDAPLSEQAKDASLWVCAECCQRVSPPAALAEARRAAIR